MKVSDIGLVLCFASVSAAAYATAPPPPTEWQRETHAAPFFYCANGMGLKLLPGEQMRFTKAANPGWPPVALGPLTRLEAGRFTAEIQWPLEPTNPDRVSELVYWNTRMTLIPVSQDTWGVALEPGSPNQPAEVSLENASRMVAIRFPVGADSWRGLELARRIQYVAPRDPRCSNKS